jgi:hypothetical protein
MGERIGGAMRIGQVLACAAGVAMMLSLDTGPAAAAVPAAHPTALHVAQPSSVCGYSQHARDQMEARGITPFDVRLAVALGANSAFRNSHGNWQYESSGLIVTMNDSGCVVTAMTR